MKTIKKQYLIGAIIILIIIIVVLVLNQKTPSPVINTSQPNQTSTQATNPVSGQPAPNKSVSQPAANQNVGIYHITIKNFAFSPSVLNISVGQKVIWTNQDSAPHQILADDDAYSSDVLKKGDSYAYIYTKAGTYNYHCNIHPIMKGQVIVK